MSFDIFVFMHAMLALLIAALMIMVLTKLWRAPLASLVISPEDGKVSLARVQALVMVLIVGGLFLVLSIEHGDFVDVPNGALGLLAISIGGYVASKAIDAWKSRSTQPTKKNHAPPSD